MQRFIIDRPTDVRGLYWRAYPADPTQPGHNGKHAALSDGALVIQPNTVLTFDTYFNSFFEALWRRHTRLRTLLLRLRIDGSCTLRIVRRAAGGHRLVDERVLHGGEATVALHDDALNFRQHGLLSLEIVTGNAPAVFIEASWLAEKPDMDDTGLSAVFCTFNREADIGRVLTSMAADPVVQAALAHVFVINQGRPGLAETPAVAAAAKIMGSQLRVVEQPNFGGAGGFGRGMLEALDDPQSTHVVLLDDDITVEPDSLLRMAAFFALANSAVVVGGHMLDSVQPTMLYEAGAIISERHWAFQPQHHSQNLLDHGVLEALTRPSAIHYNGWWCCGIPLSRIRKYGMPLPCFIRGDDLEYGLRLHQAGVPTVAMPGIAVWHEPFYLKIGSWHLYYEIRNMLITASLHQAPGRWDVTRRMGRHLAMSLLTFRYYNAALILRGIRDYLAGPAILRGPPQKLHANLAAIAREYPSVTTGRGVVLEPQRLMRTPRNTAGFLLVLARLVAANFIMPTRAVPARLLPVNDLAWPCMRRVDHVAVETWWDNELPTFHRSRERFRKLAPEAIRTLLALFFEGPSHVARWRAAMPELTSEGFWREYLGIPAKERPVPAGYADAAVADPVL